MENNTQLADYFRAPENTFWRWAADGVIEWKNGKTICYRDDLFNVMRLLSDNGVPTLETLLLAFAACGKEAEDATLLFVLIDKFSKEVAGVDKNEEALHMPLIKIAIAGLVKINSLSPDWKTGHRRTHLFNQVIVLSKVLFKNRLIGPEVTTAIDEYNSLNAQNYNYSPRRKYTLKQFAADLKPFAVLSEKFTDSKQLENHLCTGLPAIPLPAPIELPEEKKQGDLFQQLLEEPRTTHISRLAKKMLAALHILMHLQSSGGASYGGVSDITNRGNFDKLLLSELAADNTLLLTRLVHNEALYLRREEPPNNPKTRRLILLDTTLKLWGTPRVFAVSAAIACTQKLRPNETVEAYTLGGTHFAETNLTTTEGVLKTLEGLDAALHCTTALSACLEDVGGTGQNDTIFITGEEMITEPAFQKWMATSGDALDFIITVNGSGELHFSSVSAGRLKQLSQAKIDLEEILAEKKLGVKKSQKAPDELPAFLKLKPAPLLFPTVGNIPKVPTYSKMLGVAAIIMKNRLLYWYQKGKAAYELLPIIDIPETHYIGFGKTQNLYLLVDYGFGNNLKLHTIDLTTHSAKCTEIELMRDKQFAIAYEEESESFYFSLNSGLKFTHAVLECNRGIIKQYSSVYEKSTTVFETKDVHYTLIKKLINQSYNVVLHINTVFIDVSSRLCLGEKCISIPSPHNNHISLQQGVGIPSNTAEKVAERLVLTDNPNIYFSHFVWQDGSSLVVDGRGFLHLRSSDDILPEVTIVSIQGRSTSCWASDGTVCGNPYFQSDEMRSILPEKFYTRYITPFIQTILQKA